MMKPTKMGRIRQKSVLENDSHLWTDMFVEIQNGKQNTSGYPKIALTKKISDFIVQTVQTAAGKPAAFCNPVTNRLRSRIIANQKCRSKKGNNAAFGMIYVGILLIGVGYSIPWSLGVPLIDDNIKKRSAPLYFAGIFSLRLAGPVLGFVIGSACGRLYFTLKNPSFMPTDPRWIGAWWLGFVIISAALFPPSLLLFCFPSKGVLKTRHTHTSKPKAKSERNAEINEVLVEQNDTETSRRAGERLAGFSEREVKQASGVGLEIKGVFKAIGQILKSRVYTAALIGRLFDNFAFNGFFVFLPKYLENHFGLPLYKTNMYLGFLMVTSFATGVVIGSVAMKRLRLEGRKAAGWIMSCSLLCCLFILSQISLACHSVVNKVGQVGQYNHFNLTLPCNAECGCGPVSLSPVCDESGNIFYSPCTAGCKHMTPPVKGSSKSVFINCNCVKSNSTNVSRENCHDDCSIPLAIYLGLIVLSSIAAGSAVIPGLLILLRSVLPAHRSVALAFSSFLISLLSRLPSPIVYGSLIDGACLQWTESCGITGSCRIYNPQVLRYRMHGLNGALRMVGVMFDALVFYWAKGLKLMEEENENASMPEAEMTPDLRDQGNVMVMVKASHV